MYSNVTEELKNILKSNGIIGTARLTIVDSNTVLESNSLVDLTITDNCYNEGQLIGTAMSKELEATIVNKNNYDLADKEISCELGVVLSDGTKEFVPYGNYIVKTYEDLKQNKKFKIIAYDYMDKLNINYEHIDEITYPITLKEFYYAVCNKYDIEYEEQTLPNENFIVNVEPNFDGMTVRTVIKKCAELFGRFAKINRNNKLQMFLKNETDEIIDGYSMNSKLMINKAYGPVNVVSLELGNVEGENVVLQDEESIRINGETTIRIIDNPFTYTEDLRENAITDLFNTLKGFYYVPVEFKYKSRFYLDGGDTIKVENIQTKEKVSTIVLNQVIKVPQIRSGEFKSPALSDTAIKQKYISQSKQLQTKTEISVLKNEQKIKGIVSQIGDRSEKTTTITADIEGLQTQVIDIEDLTTTGYDYGQLNINNLNEGNILKLIVHPHLYDISDLLYPRIGLHPRENLLPNEAQHRRITFHNLTDNTYVFYDIPTNLWKINSNIYDEFVMDYENEECYVIRRVRRNADKTKEQIEETRKNLPFETISLTKGNYEVYLENFPYTYIYLKAEVSNKFTEEFASKSYTQSSILQASNEIKLSTQQTLESGYYSKQQTNTLIEDAKNGLTNVFTTTGGNNILRNTSLKATTTDTNNPYEYWTGKVQYQKEENAVNMRAILLQNDTLEQEVLVPNGIYSLAFNYQKLIPTAHCYVIINDTQYELTESTLTKFQTGLKDNDGNYITLPLEVTSNHINVKFIADTNNSCKIYDLMLNQGSYPLAYSQNQNETTTDTVIISKGITITSSDTDTTFKADVDGIRTLNGQNEITSKYTEKGMETEQMEVKKEATIVNVLWQNVSNQTWLTRI